MSGYLIVGPSWVGDMVMAQSLIISLKQRDPEAPVDVIAPAWSAPLARRMREVREAIVLPVAHREPLPEERTRHHRYSRHGWLRWRFRTRGFLDIDLA